MRARTTLALALALFSLGCGTSPASPDASSLTGRWEGTFTVTACEFSGMYTKCSTAPGAAMAAALLFLENEGDRVSGFSAFGAHTDELRHRQALLSPFWRQFHTSLGSDGTVRFSVTLGEPPTAVQEQTWQLELLAPDRLEGTLRSRDWFYKVQGDTVITGTVSLKRASGS